MDRITKNTWIFLSVLLFCFVMCSKPHYTIAAGDTISSGDSITGDQTITSSGDMFVLGFFKPSNTSEKYYIGIWYKFSVETVVWVANRDAPILDPYSSKLTLSDGNLALLSKENETPIWSTNTLNTTQVVLGDDGNLVLRNGSNPSVINWQSFDHPTDTLLPGSKFGFNKKTNQGQKLISWRSPENPATGIFNLQPESTGKNRYILYVNNSNQIWDTGEWDEETRTFPFTPEMRLNSLLNYSCISNENESYFTYSVYSNSTITKLVLDSSGPIQQFTWSARTQKWNLIWPQSRSPHVSAAEGRKRKATYRKVVLPILILAVLIVGVLVYIYLIKKKRNKGFKGVLTDWFKSKAANNNNHTNMIDDDKTEGKAQELQMFSFSCLSDATNNFCLKNKLGEGGFGPVYKGTLTDGQEIAVKRLSADSGQGGEEFKNEVALLIKLQHKNLVRLLGFCLHGNEKLLVYEYMKHGSLDQFLFDPIKRTHLNWGRRLMIIRGIAKGLLYLHEDSRLNIIHRDLKASNVLLGADMVPKISDFGMARIFKVNQYQDSTRRICGTLGYMAPEYAMLGKFSIKSDAFSFGVLILEILSGKRSNSFGNDEDAESILTYSWKLWNQGKYLELLDPTLRENHSTNEVMRCIEIALLCGQEDVAERPTMARIVHIINQNNPLNLAAPLTLAAISLRINKRTETNIPSQDDTNNLSVNEISMTEFYPR